MIINVNCTISPYSGGEGERVQRDTTMGSGARRLRAGTTKQQDGSNPAGRAAPGGAGQAAGQDNSTGGYRALRRELAA